MIVKVTTKNGVQVSRCTSPESNPDGPRQVQDWSKTIGKRPD